MITPMKMLCNFCDQEATKTVTIGLRNGKEKIVLCCDTHETDAVRAAANRSAADKAQGIFSDYCNRKQHLQ